MGGGDDSYRYRLKRLDDSPSIPVLDDWISKTRVYSMTGSFGGNETLAKKHIDALKTLDDIRAYVKFIRHVGGNPIINFQKAERALLYGLFEHEDLKGISLIGGDKSNSSLSVYRSAVYPTELNKEKSDIRTVMIEMLQVLAAFKKMKL